MDNITVQVQGKINLKLYTIISRANTWNKLLARIDLMLFLLQTLTVHWQTITDRFI